MNELLNIDKTFNESMFITKVNNIFVMLFSCVMSRNLDRVRHFISDNIEKEYDEIINYLKDNNYIQMYDELNVKESHISNINITDKKIIINVELVSRYMDYIIDSDTKKYIRGINDHRIEKTYDLTFEKSRNAVDYKLIKKCPTCGSSIDLNGNGKCSFCGNIFNTEKYDYVLTNIEEV